MLLSFFDMSPFIDAISSIFSATPQSLAFVFLMVLGVVMMNAFLLAVFGIVGAGFLKRMQISTLHIKREKEDAHKKSETLIEEARKESLHIVSEANKKATEILQQTQALKDSIEADLSKEIRELSQKEQQRVGEISSEFIEAYRKMIESTKQEYGTVVARTAKEMANDVEKSLKEFEQSLKDQTTRYEGMLKEQVQEGFMSAQKEISHYKRESLRKVEDALYRILNLVTKSVLGKALNLEDQQDLVIHALNEAKQQAFFEI